MRRNSLSLLLLVPVVGALLPGVARGDVEDELRARLRGRYALLLSPVSTECTDHYTDNDVVGAVASGRGPIVLPRGELVSIDNVDVGWTRFDVNLGLQVPYRVTLVDGPYTLHELRSCRVQLKLDVPGEVQRDRARAEAAIRRILEVHEDAGAARASASWNGREPEPLPEDAEAVWAEYRVWRAERTNAAIRARIDDLLGDARRIVQSMEDDADYLESFALGMRSRRYESTGSCESLLSSSFYGSGSGGRSKRGYADGQRVAWSLATAHALGECWLEVPGGG